MLALAERTGGAIAIPSGTARVLEGYGYIEPATGGWVLSDGGREFLESERARARFHEWTQGLSTVSRAWGDRVVHWLLALRRLGEEHPYGPYARQAELVARAGFDGVEPMQPPEWTSDVFVWLVDEVRDAARCLADFDAEGRKADERGVPLGVYFKADPKVPRARADAAEAATAGAGVVRLATYRERRPSPSGGAA
jgi:hypothetical protein